MSRKSGKAQSAVISSAPSTEIQCGHYRPQDPPANRDFSSSQTLRYGLSIFDNVNPTRTTTPDIAPPSFLSLLVNAIQVTKTRTMLDESVYCRASSNAFDLYATGESVDTTLDTTFDDQIAPLPLWDNPATGLHALAPFANNADAVDDMMFEQCGITQRVSYHNRDCPTALAALGRSDLAPQINQGYNQATGTQVTYSVGAEEARCSIREEPKVRSRCVQGTCNANGLSAVAPDRESRSG